MAEALTGRSVADVAARLLAWFQNCPGATVAFSGGVDSAVVARAASVALPGRCVAITADSPSLARRELADAVRLADSISIEHRIVSTGEVQDGAYQKNDAHRCFHCKSHLFATMSRLCEVADRRWWLVTGTNADDLGDWRPGLRAAADYGVRSPLAELGISKLTVRELAAYWGLAVADKPASPCLASRIAYGVEVTPARLAMVEAAESELWNLGFREFRVRLHADDLARIEVPLDSLPLLVDPAVRTGLVTALRGFGFKFIALDLQGFSSGNLNQLVHLQATKPLSH
jgi:pyridinium-3,5-biscarboxylic acid mononucleotide sulfurtransferase